MNKDNASKNKIPSITGHLSRQLTFAPVRILAIVTGLSLIRGILTLAGRFLLALRRKVTALIEGDSIVLKIEWSIMGKPFRKTKTIAPLSSVTAARFEDRRRYLHLLIGFGCLAVGAWVGIQWLIDGLRAGFPFLALLGAGVVAAGITIDLLLYIVIPEGQGRSRVIFAVGPWHVRIIGVDASEGELFLEALQSTWKTASPKR